MDSKIPETSSDKPPKAPLIMEPPKDPIAGSSSAAKNSSQPSRRRLLGEELKQAPLAPLTQSKPKDMVKKGKSMVEWMQKKDKFRNNTRLREVGYDELATHSDIDDVWMAVKGKVFDVTQYAGYHPGGVDELMRGAGINATTLFNQIHAYVNFDSILSGTQIGYLVGRDTLMGQPVKTLLPANQMNAVVRTSTSSRLRPPILNFSENDSHVFCQVDSSSNENYTEDWWTVGILGRERLLLKVLIKPPELWMAHVKLVEALRDDTMELTFRNNFRSLLLSLKKPDKGKWKMIGDPLTQNNEIVKSHRAIQDMHYAKIISKKYITHNVAFFTLEVIKSSHIGVPTGFHVKLRTKGSYRRYTPVCPSLLTEEKIVNGTQQYQKLYFIIKIYTDGQFTSLLDKIPVKKDDETYDVQVSSSRQQVEELEVGCSSGAFTLDFIKSDILIFLAAGSGITPFIRILKHIIDNKRILFPKSHIVLIFCNQAETDIIWRDEWEALVKKYSWFTFIPVLSRAKDNWKGLRGRISSQILKQCLDSLPKSILPDAKIRRSIICGNYGFNKLSKSLVLEPTFLNLTEDDVYVFAG